MTSDVMRIGFLPLVDAALIIVAHEFGFAEAEGLQLQLVRDMSWASVRDRLIYGRTDAAHLVAPLALATSLGIGRPAVPLIAPFVLGLNGNAITLRAELAEQLPYALDDPAATGRALLALIGQLGRRLRIGVVHRHSSHNLMLRYWLAAKGIDPLRDVEIVIVPPPYTVDALRSGEIDGACVGEPWNSGAVDSGYAQIIAVTSAIWRRGVEKVLALRADTADARAPELAALLRALHRAGAYIAMSEHHETVANVLARPAYLDAPAERIQRSLAHRLVLKAGGPSVEVPNFLLTHDEAANFPWTSQALWLYGQMVRWGDADFSSQSESIVRSVFRPDLYRRALRGTGAPLPGASAKVEGGIESSVAVGTTQGRLILGPDQFFDNRSFDPENLPNYLAQF